MHLCGPAMLCYVVTIQMMYSTSLSGLRPDGEIRNRAHGHESIEVLNVAARVPKGFAPVYSDVQLGLDEVFMTLSNGSAKKKWQEFGTGFGLRSK